MRYELDRGGDLKVIEIGSNKYVTSILGRGLEAYIHIDARVQADSGRRDAAL